MQRTLSVALAIAGCGRLGFDATARPGPHDAPPLRDIASFDAPTMCLAAMAPGPCVTSATGVKAISVGLDHACASRSGARMDCWGDNQHGELGLCPSVTGVDVPTASYAFDVAQLAMGEQHSCARLVDGSVWCWGARDEGQTANMMSSTPDPVPHQVPGVYTDLSTRRFHSCAIDSTGALWCWGRNLEGELGIGDQTDRATPQRVGTASDWLLVRAGGLATCGLRTGGVAWCWGDNTQDELGVVTSSTFSDVPVQVSGTTRFTQLALGKEHACGLDGSGAAWCWGYGTDGQIGNGMIGSSANAIQPYHVAGTYQQIATGWFQSCALDLAGALWCWGDNSMMNLLPTIQTSYATPIEIDAGPWAEVEAGQYMTCVRAASGEVRCWGQNTAGQLGVGDMVTPHSTPTPVCFGS